MPQTLSINIPRRMAKTEARRRIQAGFGDLRSQLTTGIGRMLTCDERWEGDRLHFSGGTLGQKITGRLDVADDVVRIEVDLPGIFAVLGSRIAGRLQTEAQRLLK